MTTATECTTNQTEVIVEIQFDPELEDPSTFDGWKLYSGHRGHLSFKDFREFQDDNGHLNIGLRRKLAVGTAFILGYFEHGRCVWHLNSERPLGTEGDYRWDGTPGAGILIWEPPAKELGAKTPQARREDACNFLEVYTAYCNGDGLYYTIESRHYCESCEQNRTEVQAGCGGFYDPTDRDHMLEMIRADTKGFKVVEVKGDGAGDLTPEDVQG